MDILLLRILNITSEAKDTVTIFLERADGKLLDYQAGQFLTLLININGREWRRSYSFSSAPGIDKTPSITVKRVINGTVSRYLADHSRVGDELRSLPPSGRFVLEHAKENADRFSELKGRFFFIAAGSGMVPVFSLMKMTLEKMQRSQVVLISQHHDKESILFREQLDELQKKYQKKFWWVNMLSTPGMRGAELQDTGTPAHFGRLTNLLLQDLLEEIFAVQGWASREEESWMFYLCGPPAFMRLAQFTLRLMGIAEGQIKKEHFTVEFLPPPPSLTDLSPKLITVHYSGQTHSFKATYPSNILQAALDHHIPLPYSCRGGRCSSCTARLLNGKIRMSINEVLTEKDLQDGLVLTCVGYAETDVELSY